MATAAILGLTGPRLTACEASFFREADPWGFILFSRNIAEPEQLRRLTARLRETVGREAPILVDQEGGRVQRLGPPHWREWPPVAGLFDGADDSAALEAARLRYRIIADELRAVGIDVNCTPLLDVPAPECHTIIGNRALGGAVEDVVRRGRAVCDGLLAGGVLPVIKHIPGHGRATVDSHEALPRVAASRAELERVDFAPFRALADQALGMTAHVIYEAIDPERCATLSPDVVSVIRDEIGFEGLLMSDDVSMRALAGPIGGRAADALAAGCDVVLHCNGRMDEMEAVAAAVTPLAGAAAARAARAEAARPTPDNVDVGMAVARYEEITRGAMHG